MLYKVKFLNSFRVALVFPTMFHFLFFISSSCNAILLFQYTMCLAAIYVIVIVQSAGLNSLSTLNFFKEGHVLEILDACIIDTQPLLINSLGQCASQCPLQHLLISCLAPAIFLYDINYPFCCNIFFLTISIFWNKLHNGIICKFYSLYLF